MREPCPDEEATEPAHRGRGRVSCSREGIPESICDRAKANVTWLSQASRRIGSPDAISWPVFWITLAAGLIGNVVTNADAPIGTRMLALGIGQVALWLPLALIRPLLNRRPDRPRPVLVLGAAMCGLMMRALAIGVVFSVLLGEGEVKWSNRFVGALFNVGLAFVVSSYIVSAVRERRRQISELQAIERELASLVAEVSKEFEHRNQETVAKTQAILLAELSALDPDDAQRSLAVLQRTASDVVRPLSHELAKSRPGDIQQPIALVDAKVSWRDVLDSAARGKPFLPGVTALFIGMEMVAAAVAYPPGIGPFVVLNLIFWGLLRAANELLQIVLRGRGRGIRLTLVLLAALFIGGVMAILVRAILPNAPMIEGLIFGAFFFCVIFTIGVGIASAFARDREGIAHELQESSRTLQRRLVQWRQAQWFQQKALSRALHGPVQTAVTAGALHLDVAIRSGEVGSATVEQVRAELLETLQGLGSLAASVTSLSEALYRIARTWEGLCAISADLGPGVDDELAENAPLRSCVIDIVTEAISNAVRHGDATIAVVTISVVGDSGRDLLVVIESDSFGEDREGGRGLGTLLLEECTLQWTLEDFPHGKTLTVLLPLETSFRG